MQCPTCGGEGEALGVLGILLHLRCRNCGTTFSRVVQRCKQCNGIMGDGENPGDGRCYECHSKDLCANPEEGDPEPQEVESEVWSHNEISHPFETGHGYVCHSSTNDNLDTGYPGEHASWETRWGSLEACLRACGVCRVGVVGHRTTTMFLGERVTSIDQAVELDGQFRATFEESKADA